MGIMRPQNDKMKPIAMAVGGSIIAAVATMFVPASMLESITGATGLSELVPATGAPLGDTARALIAFGTGAVTLVFLLAFALRQPDMVGSKQYSAPTAASTKAASYNDIEEGTDRFSGLKERVAQLRLPKMPWAKGDDDILDLADLPKLRSNDAHPDAPPRRPISILNDVEDSRAPAKDEPLVPTPPVYEASVADITDEVPDPSELEYSASADEAFVSPSVYQPVVAVDEKPAAIQPVSDQPSLTEMVAQMEAAVALRKQQLQALEVVAAEMMAGKSHSDPVVPQSAAETATVDQVDETPVGHDHVAERPPLEAVPSAPRGDEDDDMDVALSAALETLQRMNRAGG